MKIKLLIFSILLLDCLSTESTIPDKNTDEYIKSISAGKKIINLDLTQKELGKNIEDIDTRKEQLLKALSINHHLRNHLLIDLGSLASKLDNSFERVTNALNKFKTVINEDTSITIESKKNHLQNLTDLLDSPDALHILLPKNINNAYLEAISYPPIATFVQEIHFVAKNWLKKNAIDTLNEPNLSPEGYLFYAIIKEELYEIFADIFSHEINQQESSTKIALATQCNCPENQILFMDFDANTNELENGVMQSLSIEKASVHRMIYEYGQKIEKEKKIILEMQATLPRNSHKHNTLGNKYREFQQNGSLCSNALYTLARNINHYTTDRLQVIAKAIAKKQRANAIMPLNKEQSIILNNAADITKEAFKQLNEVAMEPTLPKECIFLNEAKNKQTKQEKTPQEALHEAIEENSTHSIWQAISLGADVNQQTKGQNPLHSAVIMKHYDAIKSLLEAGAQSTIDLIKYAADIRTATLLGAYIKAFDFNAKYYIHNKQDTLINHAIINDDIESIIALIKKGVLYQADIILSKISLYNIEYASVLLNELTQRGCNINQVWENDSIYHPERLKLILSLGANPNYVNPKNANGFAPLFIAILHRNRQDVFGSEVVSILLANGASVNTKATAPYGGEYTPLSLALSSHNSNEIVQLLVEHGAK